MSKRSTDDDFSSAAETLSRKQVMDATRRKTSLDEADLRGVDLSGINFDGMSLRNAKLAEANLTRATFRDCDLTGASLWNSTMKDAVLDGAQLENADLDFANLDGVSLKGALVKKAIFPFKAVSMDDIQDAVRTGRRLRMDIRRLHEDD